MRTIPKRNRLLFLSLLWLFVSSASAQSGNIISVSTGENYFKGTVDAVNALGGIQKFVKKGQKVGLLINSDFEEKATYVNPDVAIAVVKLCIDAGASGIVCLQHVKPEYWQRSQLYAQYSDMLAKVTTVEANSFPAKYDSLNFIKFDSIPGAKSLKKTEVVKMLFDIDAFISIPIAKHHATTVLTCAAKNMMGLCTRATNVTMHLNGPKRNDPGYLAQCITDLFLLRKPDLIVADATEMIVTNGPGGPGEIRKFDKIVAGTSPVCVDTYCTQLLGFSNDDVLSNTKGFEAGLGEMDLQKIKIIQNQN
jgi:uncharacterized protein (DUF362 family)